MYVSINQINKLINFVINLGTPIEAGRAGDENAKIEN